MTYGARGQGLSDWQTPSGGQGGNVNSSVFVTGLVNAIDFLHSTPDQPYPENQTCAGRYPTAVTAYNPFFDRIDRARLGVAGRSEEHTSELQSLMRISYAVFCLKKKTA